MIYLDHNSTTYINLEARSFGFDLASGTFNPSSIHRLGRKAKGLIEEARISLSEMLGLTISGDYSLSDYNIVFTSGGTEANNIVINNNLNAEIFISPVEHPSVLEPAKRASNVKYLKINDQGVFDLNHFESIIASSSAKHKLVSVMMANNETGVLSPMRDIVSIAKNYGALVHSDIVQAPGKMHLNLQDLDLDYATVSGHKFGGMIGSGALVFKSKLPIESIILGGGQERGVRSGTEAVIPICVMGKAAKAISDKEILQERIAHMLNLRNYLEKNIEEQLPRSKIVAKNSDRLPNTSLIMTSGQTSKLQLISLDLRGIAVSSGSACSSGKFKESHVLKSMQVPGYKDSAAIRVSTGYNTTKEDIDKFVEAFIQINS